MFITDHLSWAVAVAKW